jgi:hypothetical protein
MRKSSMVLLAVAAVVAAAVLAGPASASASVWLHEGKPLSEHVELSLTGGEVIEVDTSALLCDTTATLTTEGGSTAQITAFEVEQGSCIGLAGELEGCQVTAATAENLPWDVNVDSADLAAFETGVAYLFDEGCPVDELETGFPELILTPEEPTAIRLFHFDEEGTGMVDGEAEPLVDSGALQLPEADFGTYGIG